jgi:hypothetical protein
MGLAVTFLGMGWVRNTCVQYMLVKAFRRAWGSGWPKAT